MKDFSIFTVQSLRYLNGGGLDLAQDGKLDFLSKIQLSKKMGNRNNIQSKIPVHENNWVS